MVTVYGDDFVYDYDDFSNFDEHSSENEEELDEIEDEEVDDEEELPFCICGMPNNHKIIACEQRNCRVQWYHPGGYSSLVLVGMCRHRIWK